MKKINKIALSVAVMMAVGIGFIEYSAQHTNDGQVYVEIFSGL